MKFRRPTAHVEALHKDAADPVALDVAQTASDTPDDLTCIRGLDAPSAAKLASIGIQRFAQIAAWQPDDVTTIALALDLGRDFVRHDVIEQAKMLSVVRTARPAQHLPTDAHTASSVAIWLPHACAVAAPAALTSPTLTDDDYQSLKRELRRGVGRHHLRALAEIAPALATAITVSEIYFDPFETEAGWRPLPLVVLPTQTGENASELPVATSTVVAHMAAVAQPDRAGAVEYAAEPSLAVLDTPSPLHVAAGTRLDQLEAEIQALGGAPAIVPVIATVPDIFVTPAAAPRVINGATIQTAATMRESLQREAPAIGHSEEADVMITVHRSKTAPVAVIPELPLRPKRLVLQNEPTVARPVPNTEVSEAAVVIVKRRAAERAAPDLEFYKVPGSGNEAGPVQRMLRAVKVL